MNNHFEHISCIVLAAGKGTRIGPHLPKVLYPIAGKPMLHYTLELINKVPITDTVVVVGYRAIDVISSIKNEGVNHVYQEEQLGTGHAVGLAIPKIKADSKFLVIFNGDDSAFFETTTIRRFIENHQSSKAVLSFITSYVDSPSGLGRIVRDDKGYPVKIVEEKAATDKEKKISEVNVGCYIFDTDWIRKNIDLVKKNSAGEYYLTDLIQMALGNDKTVNTFLLENGGEWCGVNTQEQLVAANEKMFLRLEKIKEPTVFLFDMHNTLINTDLLKVRISENLGKFENYNDLTSIYWEEYEKNRQEVRYISMPDICDAVETRTGYAGISVRLKEMLYGIKFDDFLNPGIEEIMEYLDTKGEIAILDEGDLVYEPISIRSLSVSKYINEIYVFENLDINFKNINHTYVGRRKVYINDKISELEGFKQNSINVVTIHLKQGRYADLAPRDSKFKADFTAKDMFEVLNYIKGLY